MSLRSFFCRHKSMLRDRDDSGRLVLRCACGYSVPALKRSEAEWASVKSGERFNILAAQVKPKTVRRRRNNVTPMRREA